MRRKDKCVRWLHEILFSLNLSILVVSCEGAKQGSVFLGILAYPLYRYLYPIADRLYGRPNFHPGRSVEFVAFCSLLAVIFLICLRFLAWIHVERPVLRAVPGFVAVGAIPLFWLHFGALGELSLVSEVWLLLELTLAAFALFFHLWRGLPRNMALVALFLLIHFGIWGWVSFEPPWNWLSLAYLILGFLSSLLWTIYLRQTATREGNGS